MKRNSIFTLAIVLLVSTAVVAVFSGCDTGNNLENKECVVMLGDSIFDLSGEEPAALQDLSGQKWRAYYKSGAQMNGGSIIAASDIEDQLDDAIDDGYIRTIIMTGGGNDFLLGTGGAAATEMELKQAWGRILDKSKNAGVEVIIFQGYYQTTSATAAQLEVNDNIIAWLPAQGAARGITIYTYNPHTDPWFTGQRPRSYTIYDGIHPSTATSEHMAEMIWNIMVQNNIEQGTCADPSGPATATGGTLPSGETVSFVTADNLAMDVWEWGTTMGTNIAAYEYWGGDAQKFVLSKVTGGYEIVPIIAPGLRVDIVDGSTAVGANVQLWESNGFDCQKFTLENTGSGFQIKGVGSGLCLTVADGNIVQDTCTGSSNQVFQKK